MEAVHMEMEIQDHLKHEEEVQQLYPFMQQVLQTKITNIRPVMVLQTATLIKSDFPTCLWSSWSILSHFCWCRKHKKSVHCILCNNCYRFFRGKWCGLVIFFFSLNLRHNLQNVPCWWIKLDMNCEEYVQYWQYRIRHIESP